MGVADDPKRDDHDELLARLRDAADQQRAYRLSLEDDIRQRANEVLSDPHADPADRVRATWIRYHDFHVSIGRPPLSYLDWLNSLTPGELESHSEHHER